MIMINNNGFFTIPAGVRLAGRFQDWGEEGCIPRSSPSLQRYVCWGSVLGEQESEAEGKGSFGFHGRPVEEKKANRIRFKGPRAQLLTPPPPGSHAPPQE